MKREAKDILSIDRSRLDDEWCEQPNLYGRYALLAADARKAMDQAKSNLEVVRAELDKEIRADPDEYGLQKATEASISAAIPIQQEYKQANQEYLDARHKYDVYQAMTAALDHRKSALGKLVDLFLASYFSKPKSSKAVSNERMEEAVKDHVRKKVKVRR